MTLPSQDMPKEVITVFGYLKTLGNRDRPDYVKVFDAVSFERENERERGFLSVRCSSEARRSDIRGFV